MFAHNLEQMTSAVMNAIGGKLSGKREARCEAKIHRALQKYWADKAAIVWTIDDVMDTCTGLTRAEAMNVLETVVDDHDAALGVNWQTIESTAMTLYGAQALGDEEED